MRHTISPDRTRLVITASDEDRCALRELGESIHQDTTLYDFFEPLVCNSELEWIDALDTGDLTDAPMLGLYAPFCSNNAEKLLERWAFMDYQIRSVLEDLRDKDEAVFVGGPL